MEVLVIVRRIIDDYKLWYKASNVPVLAIECSQRLWMPPPDGCFKLNTDAATIKREADFVGLGLGGVIRDAAGLVIACLAQRLEGQ